MAAPNAVREISETLTQILQTALAGIIPASNVLIATPDSFNKLTKPACTIFLYRVAVNPVMRNGPRVTVAPGKTSRPLLPVDLSYLITPWGNVPGDEHQILGVALQALYDHAELGRQDLSGDSWLPSDSVQVTLETLSIEEHFCIWDTVQMPYRLSLTYMARIIGIAPSVTDSSPPVVKAIFAAAPS
jgi:Pvc16 N-terminal domain